MCCRGTYNSMHATFSLKIINKSSNMFDKSSTVISLLGACSTNIYLFLLSMQLSQKVKLQLTISPLQYRVTRAFYHRTLSAHCQLPAANDNTTLVCCAVNDGLALMWNGTKSQQNSKPLCSVLGILFSTHGAMPLLYHLHINL